jgi:hypothetical protein
MGITSGLEKLPYLFWRTFIGMLAVQPVYTWLTSTTTMEYVLSGKMSVADPRSLGQKDDQSQGLQREGGGDSTA